MFVPRTQQTKALFSEKSILIFPKSVHPHQNLCFRRNRSNPTSKMSKRASLSADSTPSPDLLLSAAISPPPRAKVRREVGGVLAVFSSSCLTSSTNPFRGFNLLCVELLGVIVSFLVLLDMPSFALVAHIFDACGDCCSY